MYYRVIKKIHDYNPKSKVSICIGGWNFNEKGGTKHIFGDMASTFENRQIFITSVMNFVRKHGFDGVELDWEYPGFEDQGGKPRDKENFVKLVQEMRQAINDERLLDGKERIIFSIAAASGEDKIIKGYDIPRLHPHLDWIHVMTYDFHGAWDSVTNSHTSVYPFSKNSNQKYTMEYIKIYIIIYLYDYYYNVVMLLIIG